jgi:hypothetical protein
MATVTIVDTTPSVQQLELALETCCGALVTQDVTVIHGQVVQAIEGIRRALCDLRPAREAGPGALAYGFVMAAESPAAQSQGHPIS